MDLSTIVLSYNTKDITDECLRRLQSSVVSCQRKLKNKIEIIVLDNASSDGSVEMIKRNHPYVRLIESKENTGFSKGNNIGLKQAKNPYILLLNSDVYVEDDSITASLEYFQKNPDCDVLGPKLIFGDGSFQPSAGNLPSPFNIPCWILGLSLIPVVKELTFPFHPNYKSFFSNAKEVGWVSGAFFMLKREVFIKVGGFDESIFMYLEEVELCKRIDLAGFNIWYVPSIQVTHLHGASSSADKSVIFIRELSGLKVYLKKYYCLAYPLVKVFLILGLIIRIIAFSFLGKFNRANAYMGGLGVI